MWCIPCLYGSTDIYIYTLWCVYTRLHFDEARYQSSQYYCVLQ